MHISPRTPATPPSGLAWVLSFHRPVVGPRVEAVVMTRAGDAHELGLNRARRAASRGDLAAWCWRFSPWLLLGEPRSRAVRATRLGQRVVARHGRRARSLARFSLVSPSLFQGHGRPVGASGVVCAARGVPRPRLESDGRLATVEATRFCGMTRPAQCNLRALVMALSFRPL